MPGPAARTPREYYNDFWKVNVNALAVAVNDLLLELKEVCEAETVDVVLLTPDARSGRGKGELHKTHFFTDQRVRSLLGDAARFHAHQRYLLEPVGAGLRIVTWKDTAEGRTGRIVFDPLRAPSRTDDDDAGSNWTELVPGCTTDPARLRHQAKKRVDTVLQHLNSGLGTQVVPAPLAAKSRRTFPMKSTSRPGRAQSLEDMDREIDAALKQVSWDDD